eukprot:94338_1
MSQKKSKKEQKSICDLEDEILQYISNSSIEPIQAAGKSYINQWSSIHFTKGKYSNHMTIQQSTLQCIYSFLFFEYSNNYQIQLFYTWVKANSRQRTKELAKKIVQSVDKNMELKPNLHFHMDNQDENLDNDSKNNVEHKDNDIEIKPGSFGYEYNNLDAFQLIKLKSINIYNAIIKSDKNYFIDLKKNHDVKIDFDSVLTWSS